MDRRGKKEPDDGNWVQAAKEEVLPGYEEYLVLLQERNRLLKRLRKKNKSQIELERKEQGFSLYVNGPHSKDAASAKTGHSPVKNIPTQPKTARKPKTAGEGRNPNVLDHRALDEITKLEIEKQKENRAKTAPGPRERRRNWNVQSVEIKTTEGGKKVKAPDILSGRYDDDFESDENSDDLHSSASENSMEEVPVNKKPMRKPPPPRESDMFNSDDSINSEEEQMLVSQQMSAVLEQDSEDELEIDASKFSKPSSFSPRKAQRSNKNGRQRHPDSDDEGPSEKLMLSMRELQKLRQSLVRNATIKESLARDVCSDDDERMSQRSPIHEVEEDITTDESAVYEESPRRLNANKPMMKPDDTIVLEFGGGPPPNRKIEKSLSAARRKDADDGEYSGYNRRPGSRESGKAGNMSPGPRSFESASKKARPLSANRRTPDSTNTDTDREASAVMAALRAENEKASKFSKDDKQPTPRKKPVTKSERGQPSYDRSELPPRSHQMRPSPSPRGSISDSQDQPLVPPDKIEQIMERVLKMTPKHQRRLVKMLGKIEQSVVTDSVDVQDSSQAPPPSIKARRSVDRPMKATKPVSAQKPVSDGNIIDVTMKLTSNWGHPMRLGLTEIQVYNNNHTLVPISATDVSVRGAEDHKGTIDLLFNGKFKTNKERNMWSCRYHARRPVEVSFRVKNTSATEDFSVSQLKIWNFNKSINDLDVGVKDCQIYVGGELLYTGVIEKGCGNQVFDYGHVISLQPAPVTENTPVVEVEKSSPPEKRSSGAAKRSDYPVHVNTSNKKSVSSSSNSSEGKRPANANKRIERRSKNEALVTESKDSITSSVSDSRTRPPISPRGERSPSPAPRFPPSLQSPRSFNSANHRSISPSPTREKKKTFRSISMSSQSSASSGCESQPNAQPTSSRLTPRDKEVPIRSETRTLNHPSVNSGSYASVGSDSESEDPSRDGRNKGSTPVKHRSVKTPRKSKRMAARLDGHTSTDVDTSRSASESVERPPLPHRKSEEKVSRKSTVQKNLEDKKHEKSESDDRNKTIRADEKQSSRVVRPESENELDDTLKAPSVGGDVSSSISVASSQDDTPMLQKLKDMNKKDQNAGRRKDIPRWLKQEDVPAGPFESPPDSRAGRPEATPEPQEVPRTPPTQEEINMLIDEEMSMFPADNKKPANQQDLQTTQETAEVGTPMQRIQKNRSKWRENQGLNLEESWGSLNDFNKHQRGRISLDMDDDVLDEYINKAAKMAGLPTNPTIQEEEESTEVDHMAMEMDEDTFVIPELPYGKELVISIGTTWGDKHYVGLTGIEAFSSTGEQINIVKIKADPSDINILEEYKNDPRVVRNLADGVNRTRDDIHMWLAPFVQGKDHLVFCTFDKPCKLSMLRIWNYNKSRIHSYRGAKDVFIMLDSNVIFKGEIARACGGIEGGTEAFGDTILFTTDEAILEAVSQNDEAYEGEMLSDDEPFDVERPPTADSGHAHERPFTRAVGNVKQLEQERTAVSPTPVHELEGDVLVYKGKCVELNFTATWGDHHYLGLTGLEIVGKDGEALPVNMSMVTANPQDVRSLPGHERDDRTLDKLIDGVNVTMGDENMWLIPFNAGQNHTLTITFNEKQLMAGLRLWNYNKSKEDTYRGAKIVHVSIDGKMVSPREGYLIRKGPGNCHFDYAQELAFGPQSGGMMSVRPNQGMVESADYEMYQMPSGFIYQLQLFTTWGDSYYVGLNGIEFYDGNLQKIQLTETNISAYPDSVNVLENIQNDARTPDKLIDGINDTQDGGHMWLAPMLPGVLNRVYVIFDQPTTISMIKVWNYSKTSNRGAKDFALLVDDLLVYNGVLEAVKQGARGILPTCSGPQAYHTILFTTNKEVLRKEKHTIINHQTDEQDVQMTNDKKIVSHYNDPKKASAGKPVDQSKRPKTSVIHSKKRR